MVSVHENLLCYLLLKLFLFKVRGVQSIHGRFAMWSAHHCRVSWIAKDVL